MFHLVSPEELGLLQHRAQLMQPLQVELLDAEETRGAAEMVNGLRLHSAANQWPLKGASRYCSTFTHACTHSLIHTATAALS